MKEHWSRYQWAHRIIYIIDKNNNKKWAVSRKYEDDSDIKWWTEKDHEISPLMMSLEEDVILYVMKQLRRPQFEIECDVLKEKNIFLTTGTIIPIENAKTNELEWFKKMFGKFLTKSFSDKLGIEKYNKSLLTTIKSYKDNVYDPERIISADFDSLDSSRIMDILNRINNIQ
jgi:hypothetical protein